MITRIAAFEFKKLVLSGETVDVLDVRTPAEFSAMHVEMARNEPLDQLDPVAIQAARNGTTDRPLYILCRSGARSAQACEKFLGAGFKNIVNVEGGTMACAAAGVPIVRGKSSVSLDCQVQILVGLLVLAGSALTYWSHPFWLALPAAMGAGLVYSGLTNTCVLGAILARMPWNLSSPGSSKTAPQNTTCCSK